MLVCVCGFEVSILLDIIAQRDTGFKLWVGNLLCGFILKQSLKSVSEVVLLLLRLFG